MRLNEFINSKLVGYIAVALIVCSVYVACFFYYLKAVQECTSDPLVYGAKELADKYSYDFYGSGSLQVQGSPIIYFSNYGIYAEAVSSDSSHVVGNITLSNQLG